MEEVAYIGGKYKSLSKNKINDVILNGESLIKNKVVDLTSTIEDIKNSIDNDVFVIVDALPTENIKSKIYCVLDSTGGGTDNKYIEWVYTNGAWEKVGEFQAIPNLDEYLPIAIPTGGKTVTLKDGSGITIAREGKISKTTLLNDSWNEKGSYPYSSKGRIYVDSKIAGNGGEFRGYTDETYSKLNMENHFRFSTLGSNWEFENLSRVYDNNDTNSYTTCLSQVIADPGYKNRKYVNAGYCMDPKFSSTETKLAILDAIYNTGACQSLLQTYNDDYTNVYEASLLSNFNTSNIVSKDVHLYIGIADRTLDTSHNTIKTKAGHLIENVDGSIELILGEIIDNTYQDSSVVIKSSDDEYGIKVYSKTAKDVLGCNFNFLHLGANDNTANYTNICPLVQDTTDITKWYVPTEYIQLDTKVSKAGDTMTGKLSVPYIETGTNANNYFQCQKFRGEGDASKYYHAIDFGYANHNQVDFYEYGATWNFWKSNTGTADSSTKVGAITSTGWNGPAVLTGTPTAPTAASNTNSTQIATTAFVQNNLSTKVDKETGKGLSTNDYTTAEKTKLAGIAENANNYSLPIASSTTLGGVKVDDSLNSTSTNPVQNKVINNSINSINSTIAEISCVYGVRHYYNNSSTALTRIGSSNLHVALPVQSLMRRCVLADDGSVVYYLDANDSTKKEDGTDAVLDGTDGQVMVEVPEHYRRHTLGSDYYDSEISLVPFTGAFKVNKYYVSMSEAAMDRTNSKLASVVNTTAQYRGGNNTSDWDDTYKSLLGMPATSMSTINFHTYANNRGTGWEMYEIDVHDDIYWLYVIEYANLNVQLAYNSELTSEGYHQGGLGNGVIGKDWSTWSSYNSNNPIIPCGATLSLGNNSGVVTCSPLSSDGSTAWGTFSVPSYRGIQNLYAHIWQWAIGYMGVGNGTNQVAYRCRNRKHYSTSSLNNYYSQVELISSSGGWIKTIVKNKYGDIIPTSVGAGDTTYFSDYLWEAHNNGSIYTARVGGCLHNGSDCGLGCLVLINGFGIASSNYGSRLVYCASDYIVEA